MKLYALHVYEGVYQALHGIERFLLIKCDDVEEAHDYAREESIDIMHSYGDIVERFVEDALAEGLEEGSDDYEEYVDCRICENVAYNIWEVDEEEIELAFEDTDAAENAFWNSPKTFIEKYCIEIE